MKRRFFFYFLGPSATWSATVIGFTRFPMAWPMIPHHALKVWCHQFRAKGATIWMKNTGKYEASNSNMIRRLASLGPDCVVW